MIDQNRCSRSPEYALVTSGNLTTPPEITVYEMRPNKTTHLVAVSDRVLARLQAHMDTGDLLTSSDRVEKYNRADYGGPSGHTTAVTRPATVEEISSILRICQEERVGVVPMGGGTGFVGGSAAPRGMLGLSLERLNRIRKIEPESGFIVVEAGCVLATAQEAARKAGLCLPLSFGAEGSAQIGGALATNAGGLRAVRFGSARNLCLGLEAVLPDGSIWDGLRCVRKDNTGYDLKQLLIGSEGTLGVLSAAALRLVPEPVERMAAVVAFNKETDTIPLFHRLQATSANCVSAFEFFGYGAVSLAAERGDLRAPFHDLSGAHALIEVDSGSAGVARDILERVLSDALENEILTDAVQCKHGATAGKLPEDKIFYCESRGISQDEARKLLTIRW